MIIPYYRETNPEFVDLANAQSRKSSPITSTAHDMKLH